MDIRPLLITQFDRGVIWLLTAGVRLVLVLVAAYLLLRMIRLLTGRLNGMLQGLSLEQQKRAQTLSEIVQAAATTVLFVITAMLVLGEIGVNIAPLLAAAGIGGLAIGFGAQNLVRDLITGFFLLLEDQIRVGDVVKVGEKSGLVEQLGLRVLILRDCDGSVHMIPNGSITTVTNLTRDFSYAVLHIGVSYHTDIDEAVAVLMQVGADLRHDPQFAADLLGDLQVVGIDDFADAQVKLTLRLKTLPSKQWQVSRALRRRIKKAFDERNIPMREGLQLPQTGQDSSRKEETDHLASDRQAIEQRPAKG
ncbi:MAG TPA: mechanosensitive ion channel family protein [Candidatus Binatia bacterium]|jgi:small conductance mechanosensitive channel|nr:mechanosensitive ion channel family protein [Candidatus Binatia bacterium]